MQTQNNEMIVVQTTINAPVAKVWQYFTLPEHITQWSFASDEWHTPTATNDLKPGGHFTSRMEAKDGSMGFDFAGTYDAVKNHEHIAYTMGDNRKVAIEFKENGNTTTLVESFEPETTNPVEMQRGGWQAILDNFKKYVEAEK
jgi:uncharacterized protein YndB with AHSA1/START domain